MQPPTKTFHEPRFLGVRREAKRHAALARARKAFELRHVSPRGESAAAPRLPPPSTTLVRRRTLPSSARRSAEPQQADGSDARSKIVGASGHRRGARRFALLAFVVFVIAGATTQGAGLSISIVDFDAVTPLPARVHLKDEKGTAIRAPELPFFRDHFSCDGRAHLELSPGRYRYEIERGPEYSAAHGELVVTDRVEEKLTVQLRRLANLASEGWWSGDLHVHRPLEQIEWLRRAEDLHVAPVITWWNNQNRWKTNSGPDQVLRRFDRNRFYHVMAGEDEREGGALLFFGLSAPLPITGANREYPSPLEFVRSARQRKNVWIDIEKPFWWDVPIWLASGQMNSVGLANNHMCRDQMYESEAWGKPRDPQRLPAPRGNGFWTQEIYYHILNSGLRLPPSAGSASGVLPNPVGYNRVYVHVGKTLSYKKWWEGLRDGRSFVSNGPLLRCRANGELPGHVFKSRSGRPVDIKIEAAITSREPLSTIEIIKNGRVERTITLKPPTKTAPALKNQESRIEDHDLGTIRFDESGWFLVRTIVDNPKTFRFASTAPYYVEVGKGRQRISRASAQFFLDWVIERKGRVKLEDPGQRAEVLRHHETAERFWRERLALANAE